MMTVTCYSLLSVEAQLGNTGAVAGWCDKQVCKYIASQENDSQWFALVDAW